jgi:hypothetical protein
MNINHWYWRMTKSDAITGRHYFNRWICLFTGAQDEKY